MDRRQHPNERSDANLAPLAPITIAGAGPAGLAAALAIAQAGGPHMS